MKGTFKPVGEAANTGMCLMVLRLLKAKWKSSGGKRQAGNQLTKGEAGSVVDAAKGGLALRKVGFRKFRDNLSTRGSELIGLQGWEGSNCAIYNTVKRVKKELCVASNG